MAISITWGTKVVYVPKDYLTLVTGTFYELDSNKLRLDVKKLEEDDPGMPFPDVTSHNTEVTISGVTYVRTIEVINGYSIEFEDGQYTVSIIGSNNNYHDVQGGVLVQNQVQVIPNNSAGYISVSDGGAAAPQSLFVKYKDDGGIVYTGTVAGLT